MRIAPVLFAAALVFSFCAVAADKEGGAPQTYRGTLSAHVMGPGGETTGVALIMKDGSQYELDLGKNADIANLADSLDGKPVVVTGVLHIRKGVIVPERRIIEVTALKSGG